jgi:exosortase/archaeosortase family protein
MVAPARRASVFTRFCLRAVPLVALFYGVAYYPYADGGVVARAIGCYLRAVALASGAVAHLFDAGVTVAGTSIEGRQTLRIVLDCAAPDAHALFSAAVLAYPGRGKLVALLGGNALIATGNVLRIVLLYFLGAAGVGTAGFATWHEDVLPIALVLLAATCFAVWVHRGSRPDDEASRLEPRRA